jgi:REG-2-like HAD superfamily hydrolase
VTQHQTQPLDALRTKPSIVLIDVGDTMVRPEPSWRAIYATVFTEFGIEATSEEFEAAFRAAWPEWESEGPFEATEEGSFQRLMALDRLVFARLGHTDLPESFFRDIDAAFHRRAAWHIFPDVIPALEAMRAAGLRLGVVSNWAWTAQGLLELLGLAAYFETFSISARVGYQKPHAAIFEDALEQLGARPEEAIHIGDDAGADVVGARRAGIEPILLMRENRRPPLVGSDGGDALVASDFNEILGFLGMAPKANASGS